MTAHIPARVLTPENLRGDVCLNLQSILEQVIYPGKEWIDSPDLKIMAFLGEKETCDPWEIYAMPGDTPAPDIPVHEREGPGTLGWRSLMGRAT